MAKLSGDAQVNARILYWGIAGAGKSTNLRVAFSKLRPDHRGELESVATSIDSSVSLFLLMPPPVRYCNAQYVRNWISRLLARRRRRCMPRPRQSANTSPASKGCSAT